MSITISTINNPEFINLRPLDINPLMSACEIKVLYVGENRNKTYIDKETATEMSKTLRGAPIVGWFREDKDDFSDHGERITFDADGVKFECMTKPYGFVDPAAKVWFQKFKVKDDSGNEYEREYLMTTGYLWSGQFEELKDVATDKGKPHSMELDKKSLKGEWAYLNNSNIEFFIINSAIFSKLCILGDDIEPCFEESDITAPHISASFTKEVDNNFKRNLYNMMQDLKFALQGGQKVEKEQNTVTTEKDVQDSYVKTDESKNDNPIDAISSYERKEEESSKKEDNPEDKENNSSSNESNNSKDDEKEKKNDYALLEEKYSLLEKKYDELVKQCDGLFAFKKDVEDKKKDELIKSFYMLSDDDKKDVVNNKDKYTLDEIESKLSVICVRKKVNFSLDDDDNNVSKTEKHEEEDPTVTFNLKDQVSVPAWVSALRNTKNSRSN